MNPKLIFTSCKKGNSNGADGIVLEFDLEIIEVAGYSDPPKISAFISRRCGGDVSLQENDPAFIKLRNIAAYVLVDIVADKHQNATLQDHSTYEIAPQYFSGHPIVFKPNSYMEFDFTACFQNSELSN